MLVRWASAVSGWWGQLVSFVTGQPCPAVSTAARFFLSVSNFLLSTKLLENFRGIEVGRTSRTGVSYAGLLYTPPRTHLAVGRVLLAHTSRVTVGIPYNTELKMDSSEHPAP
jgi:hypothetical protein